MLLQLIKILTQVTNKRDVAKELSSFQMNDHDIVIWVIKGVHFRLRGKVIVYKERFELVLMALYK